MEQLLVLPRFCKKVFNSKLALAGCVALMASAPNFSPNALAQTTAPAPKPQASAAPQRHSPLPTAALEKAREAEKQLAANAPEKAIAILRELDKQYPDQPAISLRLAQIYDTLNRSGYALFFYRRYVEYAGDNPRAMAVERVGTLELMAGIDAKVEAVEKEFGEQTRPVATPSPVIKRMLATTAKDGSLVPIRNEEDFNKIRKEGVPETSPETPIPTPQITPIFLPQSLPPTPQAASAAQQNLSAYQATSQPQSQEKLSLDISSANATPATSHDHTPTPRKSDEDALLAAAFRTSDSPAEIMASAPSTESNSAADQLTQSPPQTMSQNNTIAPVAAELAAAPTPSVSIAPPPSLSAGNVTIPAPQLKPSTPEPEAIAFTKEMPANTGRAADFFYITDAPGKYALVSLVHDVPSSMLTFTITPMDDGEVMSAILAPKEQKRVYVKPGTYNVAVNVSTTDYSPITLMTTHFKFTFSAGKQYTRRFNKTSIQMLN